MTACQPQRALVPPVAEQLGVDGEDAQPAARDALAHARHEVRRVLAGGGGPAGRVVGRAVVAPRAMAMLGERVVVAIARVGAGSRRGSRRARSSRGRSVRAAGRRRPCAAGAGGRRRRARRSGRRTSRARRPARAARRATARRRTPATRSRRASPRRSGRGARRCPCAAAGARRRPWPAAAGSRGSPTRSRRRGGRARRAARSRGRPAPPASRSARPLVARRGVLERGDDAGVAAPRRSRCRGGASRPGSSPGTSAQRSSAPGAASWSQSTGVSDSVSGGAGLEQVEQRQVGGRDRLPQPLLAERPCPEALHVGLVGVQDDRQLAAPAQASCAQDGHEVQRARAARARCRGRSAKSRASMAGTKRS